MDVPAFTVTVEKKDVVSVEVVEGMMKITWHDDVWKGWNELHDSEAIQSLITVNNKKL